ncbi:MAG TPA: hypothetical protein PKD37_04105 [Oligoflexia bacterium]|nr:hypothetical protein [Oligoflexia bacterium]
MRITLGLRARIKSLLSSANSKSLPDSKIVKTNPLSIHRLGDLFFRLLGSPFAGVARFLTSSRL